MKREIIIRRAQRSDVGLIFEYILKLARYENMEDDVTATLDSLEESLFDRRSAEVLLAEYEGKPAGFALFFENFSTFLGKPGIHLEDLYVDEDKRSLGIGKALFQAVAGETAKRGYGRMEWACLNWNQPSIDFYTYLGATPMKDWTVYRLFGDSIVQAVEK